MKKVFFLTFLLAYIFVFSLPTAHAAILFESDWSTATGTSSLAKGDGGKWTTVGSGGEVVSAAGLGFPPTIVNAFKVEWYPGPGGFLHKSGMNIPSVGETRYYRTYMRVDIPNGVSDQETHPIQDGYAGSNTNWIFPKVYHNLGGNDFWSPKFLGGPGGASPQTYPYNEWMGPTLSKGVVYRFEHSITRTSVTTYKVVVRIYSSEGTPLYDSGDFTNAPDGVVVLENYLAANDFTFNNVNNLDGLNAGTNDNGVAGETGVHSYQAAFCVRDDDWCGAYNNGNTPAQRRAGDLNDDGVVNILDVSLIIQNFKRRMNYDIGADINSDGTVNILDMVLLGRNWGSGTVTPPADTTPPTATITAPTAAQILPAGTTSTPLAVTTNEASTCRWSMTDVAYASMPNILAGSGSTSHTATLNGLANGGSSTTYVRCQDTAQNNMTISQSVSFSVTSSPSGSNLWANQPAGWTVRRTFSNPATTPSSGTPIYLEGSPNSLTGGTTYRVTSGYGSAPPAGGPAVLESFMPALYGSTGGGQGRFGFELVDLNADQVYIAIVDKMAADFPWSDNSNKAHQMNWGASTATQDRMLLSFRSRQIGNAGYDAGRDNMWALGDMLGGFTSPNVPTTGSRAGLLLTTAPVTRGEWVHKEMLWRRNSGTGNGEFLMWVDGVLAVNETQLNFPDGATGVARQFYVEYVNNGIGGVIPVDAYRWVAYMHVATPPADTTPPVATITAPTASQVLTAGTTSITLSVTTNETATCRWSMTDVVYASMPNTMTGSGTTSHTSTLSGLVNGGSNTTYVRCSDTAGNAMSTSASVSFSVAALGVITWNEPVGFTPLVERRFDTRATTSASGRGTGSFPTKTGGSEGWDDIEYASSQQNIVQDATAPTSAPNVLQYTWPAQTVASGSTFAPGTAQTQGFMGSAHGRKNFTKLYHRFSYKFSDNFQNHPSGTKILFHRTNENQPVGYGIRCEPIIGVTGTRLYINLQGCQDNARNFGSGANGRIYANTLQAIQTDADAIQFGTWYTFEIVLELNSAYDIGDGKLLVWMKEPSNEQPILIMNHTDLKLRSGPNPQFWNSIHQGQTWGGQGGTINQDMYTYMDHDYVSGTTSAFDTIPPVATIIAPTASQVLTAGTTSTTLSVTTNETATCRWSMTDIAYASMTNTLTGSGSTSHTATLSGLANGGSNITYVRCQDTAGNAMSTSASVSFSVASPPSGATPLFSMDYSAGAALLAGFVDGASATHGNYPEPELLLTRQAGVGPTGQDAYRYTHVASVGQPGDGGEFGYGWHRIFTGAPFAYGDRAYFRFYWRVVDSNGRFYEQSGGGGIQEARTKVMILNNGAPSATSRPILNFNVDYNGGAPQMRWTIAKGGGVDPANSAYVPLDNEWHAIQVEMQYSSAVGVADGAYRIWIDNTLQATPDASFVGQLLYADANPGSVSWGAYQNNGLASDGVHIVENAGFAITDAFTPNWVVP